MPGERFAKKLYIHIILLIKSPSIFPIYHGDSPIYYTYKFRGWFLKFPLIRIIKRTVDQNQKNWHKSLIYALWADRITKKASINTSPFNLVYGREVVLPTHLAIPSLSLVQYIDEVPTSSLHLRKMEIIKLEEQREQDKKTHAHHQALVKSSFDSNIMTRKEFQVGDLVLKWDKAHEEKGKHTKFQRMWLGPFQIVEVLGPSTFALQDLVGKRDSLPVNGQILKKYFP